MVKQLFFKKGIVNFSLSIFAFILFFSFKANAQNNPINFETGGQGANWTWTVFENDSNPPLQIVANPSVSGINTSATVAKYTTLITGNPWAGCESQHGSDIGTFTLSASNAQVKIMVYKPVISDVGIKFVNATNGSTGEIKIANTLINQWEELTFDFTSKIGETNDQIVIFPDFQPRTSLNVCYFDNITFGPTGPPLMGPTVAAPTPTAPAANVISLFSNAYNNVSVDTWKTSWSMATLNDIQIAGNDTKQYTGLDFVGIETTGANLINATSMLYFHVDAWTPNLTTFRVKLVDFGNDAAFGGGDDTEHEVVLTPTLNGWNSYDIPLSNFVNLTNRQHMAQLIFSGVPAGQGVVYIDNVYFGNNNVGVANVSNPSFKLYPNPAKNVVNLSAALKITSVEISNVLGQVVLNLNPNNEQINIDIAQLEAGIYTVKCTTSQGVTTSKLTVE